MRPWIATGISLILCAGFLFSVVRTEPDAAIVPLGCFACVMICRRSDPLGGLLFLTMLSLAGLVLSGILWAILPLLHGQPDSWAILPGALVVIAECRRFLDNEYGEGIRSRRLVFVVLFLLLAVAEVLLTLS